MAEWVLFGSGTPGSPNETDGPIALATGFTINDGGTYWCTGIEFYASSVAPTGVEVALWERIDNDTPGAQLGVEPAPGAITPGVRNRILFDTPVPVTAALFPNGLYAVMRTADRYVATGGYFLPAGETSGPITAWQHGSGFGPNGRFNIGATGADYPNGAFNGGAYWVSPIITDEDPGGATDLDLLDLAGPLMLGGSPAGLVQDVVLADVAGPALVGGSVDLLSAVLLDAPGGVSAGGSAAGLVQDLVLADASGPALAGGSPDGLSEVPLTPLELDDQLGPGVMAGGSPDVLVINEARGDLSVWPMLVQALACLEEAADTLPNPPKYRRLAGGENVVAGIDATTDECCEGLAWVRVISAVPTDSFPTPASGYQNCPPAELAVELELGILRCSPYAASGQNELQVPTPEMHAAAVAAVLVDAAAMRAAACCLGKLYPVIIGTGQQAQTEANCMGGTQRVTVAVPFCERTC